MKKTKTTGKMWTSITSTAMCGALAMTMLISQRTQAALCTVNIADGLAGPVETAVHVGDTIHYAINIDMQVSMCLFKQGTNFLVTPDGVSHRVGDNYAHPVCGVDVNVFSPGNPFTGANDGNFVNPSGVPTNTFNVGGPDFTCFTYVVQAADIGRTLSYTTPQGNILSSASTGPTGSPDGANSVWFSVIMDGIVVDCTSPTVTNKPSGQGPAHVLVVTPGVSISKECDNEFTPYGQDINFHGFVCNTGDDVLQGIFVTNTPAGGSPVQITSFDANVTTNGTSGRLYDGTLLPGECITYHGSETPINACGPQTNTVTVGATDIAGNEFFIPQTVYASDSAVCFVSTAPCISVTKTCPESISTGTESYPVSGVVTNCGNVPLINVVVIDDNGTPGDASDDTTNSIGNLDIGGSAPWQATEIVHGSCAPQTDHVRASGQDACSLVTVNATNQCTTLISCNPKICVQKGIVCKPQVGACDSSLTYGPTAVGMAGTNQSAFCYQIIAWNCGSEVLTNVNLVDNLLGALSGFPTVLNPGQFATNYYSQSYGLTNGAASTNVNTVIATGTGLTSGITTNAHSSAAAIVLPVKVSCSIVLFSTFDMDNNTNDNKVTLPTGTNVPVQVTLNICNNGKVDLDVHVSGLPSLVDCENDVTPAGVLNSYFVPAGQCTTVVGCMIVPCGTSNINVTVQGTANVGDSGLCIYDSLGNVINSAPSSCPATITCQQPVSCRVTGGGTLQPNNVDTNCILVPTLLFTSLDSNAVDHISHGGQLGAPFSHQDCGEILGNPCIRGEWEHNRHYKDGTSDAISTKFHSSNPKGVYDTLMCACLGCCGPTVDQPNGKFLGIGKKFTLCNPDDHRVCGPMPRPAPANAIIFTGIGVFGHAHTKGKGPVQNATTYAVFRVYIEDRSEPGGSHPKGGHSPADVYCFQAWDTGVLVGKKPDYSTVAVNFRKALAADSCAFIQSISTPSQIVNGVVVGGVPPGTLPSTTVAGIDAVVADQGPIWGGNQQIHPSTGATCTNVQ